MLEAIYLEMRAIGLTKSQYDFSVRWLGRSKSYASALKAADREISTDALATVCIRLQALTAHLERSQHVQQREALRQRCVRARALERRLWRTLQARTR